MKFSNYVIDAISSISDLGSNRSLDVAKSLKDLAANTENAHDAHILEILSGVLSMSYDLDKHTFSPLLTWNDGSRSFAIEDACQEDVELLESATEYIESTWIRTRLFHVVWALKNNYQYGQKAVTGYIEIFENSFDPSHWVECNHAIQCALHIASRLGKKSDPLKQVRNAINQKLIAMDGADPLFLSLALLKSVIKGATEKELEAYVQIIAKLADKNIDTANINTNLADETFYVQDQLLKQLKKQEEIQIATTNYASYYENLAETFVKKADYHTAVIMLKKACNYYSVVDRNKLLALRSRLEELQEQALKHMQSFPFQFNAEPTYKMIDQLFEGLTFEETVVQLGRIATVYNVENVKQQVLKEQTKYFFSSMFSSSMLNEKGQTVQELPPLREVDADTNPELLYKHMLFHVSKQRGMFNSITLGYAFSFLNKWGDFSEEALDFLVCDNAIVPENREDIVRDGLYMGLTGKLYTAMHILLPQTENIFRNLVKTCGDTVTFLKADGTETYKPLSALFRSDKLLECYSEDIIFTFQSVMDEPAGENLRNLNAHGLLEPNIGNNISSLYFLCLLIKLLVTYSLKAQPILKKLVKQDPQKEIK